MRVSVCQKQRWPDLLPEVTELGSSSAKLCSCYTAPTHIHPDLNSTSPLLLCPASRAHTRAHYSLQPSVRLWGCWGDLELCTCQSGGLVPAVAYTRGPVFPHTIAHYCSPQSTTIYSYSACARTKCLSEAYQCGLGLSIKPCCTITCIRVLILKYKYVVQNKLKSVHLHWKRIYCSACFQIYPNEVMVRLISWKAEISSETCDFYINTFFSFLLICFILFFSILFSFVPDFCSTYPSNFHSLFLSHL